MAKAKKRKKLSLPRAPLPRQTEKIHQKKSKDRKVKHRRREDEYTGGDYGSDAGCANDQYCGGY